MPRSLDSVGAAGFDLEYVACSRERVRIADDSTMPERVAAPPKNVELGSVSTDSNTIGTGLVGNAGIGWQLWVVAVDGDIVATRLGCGGKRIRHIWKVPQSCGVVPVNPNSAFPLKPESASVASGKEGETLSGGYHSLLKAARRQVPNPAGVDVDCCVILGVLSYDLYRQGEHRVARK